MDKYDREIDRLKGSSHAEIEDCWSWGSSHSCLFDAISKSRNDHSVTCDDGVIHCCGCLTEIKSGNLVAQTGDLTRRIKADPEVPKLPSEITHENLHVFAKWQRIADKELGRKIPE